MQGVRHARCRELPGITFSGLGFESFPGGQQFLSVWSGSTWGGVATGTQARPFLTIGAAVAAAAALLPTAVNRIAIIVWPGTYNEQVVLANDYVDLIGVNRDSCIISFANGVGSATLLVTADAVRIERMTFRDMGTGMGYPAYFSSATGAARASVHDCAFWAGANAHTLIDDDSYVDFARCTFTNAGLSPTALRFAQDAGTSTAKDCQVTGRLQIAGAGSLDLVSSVINCQNPSVAVDVGTTGTVLIQACAVTCIDNHAISITVQPASLAILSNYLTCGGQYNSVYASLAVTGIRIENNVMFAGGIHLNVSHVDPVKWVGASGDKDWYAYTYQALLACTYADCVVKLLKDETVNAGMELRFPTGLPTTVDLNGFTITANAASTIVVIYIDDTRYVTVRNGTLAGRISSLCNTGSFTLEKVSLTGGFVLGVGAGLQCLIEDCVILYSVAHAIMPLYIANAGVIVTVKRSRLKGTAGGPAIYWTVVNNLLNLKSSQVMNGTPAVGSNPFSQSGGLAAMTYDAHQCSFNDDPDLVAGSIWTNNVAAGQRFNTIDVGADY